MLKKVSIKQLRSDGYISRFYGFLKKRAGMDLLVISF